MFALFGAGYENIIWAGDTGNVGALVFSLTQLFLAAHDGSIDRRDWLGLIAGIAALMCSGVAMILIMVVGLATLVRRGLRFALFHTAPLAVLYSIWCRRRPAISTSDVEPQWPPRATGSMGDEPGRGCLYRDGTTPRSRNRIRRCPRSRARSGMRPA